MRCLSRMAIVLAAHGIILGFCQSLAAEEPLPPQPAASEQTPPHQDTPDDETEGGEGCANDEDAPLRSFGTVIQFAKSVDAASTDAKDNSKLVFVMHISGNFAIEKFT